MKIAVVPDEICVNEKQELKDDSAPSNVEFRSLIFVINVEILEASLHAHVTPMAEDIDPRMDEFTREIPPIIVEFVEASIPAIVPVAVVLNEDKEKSNVEFNSFKFVIKVESVDASLYTTLTTEDIDPSIDEFTRESPPIIVELVDASIPVIVPVADVLNEHKEKSNVEFNSFKFVINVESVDASLYTTLTTDEIDPIIDEFTRESPPIIVELVEASIPAIVPVADVLNEEREESNVEFNSFRFVINVESVDASL